jgi:hypothetical protein
MSSTNRGNTRKVSDFYATPVPVVQSFLRAWAADFSVLGFPGIRSILDPCAGGVKPQHGSKVNIEEMAYPMAICKSSNLFPDLPSPKQIVTVDIRSDSPADICCDYRMLKIEPQPDLIISNPPFVFAQEFIEKALTDVKHGGYVVMLLRLNYFESIGRLNFWHRHMPERTYVHAERISFTKDGKTDSVAYMHAVWKARHYPAHTMLKVI